MSVEVTSGEQKLLAAILAKAITDTYHANEGYRVNAIGWINVPTSSSEHSFISICRSLDMDPKRTRRVILERSVKILAKKKIKWARAAKKKKEKEDAEKNIIPTR